MMASYSMCKCSPLLICTSLGGGATAPIFAKTTQLTFRRISTSGVSKLRKCGFTIVMISTKRNLGLSTLYIPNGLCSACPGIVEICLQCTPNEPTGKTFVDSSHDDRILNNLGIHQYLMNGITSFTTSSNPSSPPLYASSEHLDRSGEPTIFFSPILDIIFRKRFSWEECCHVLVLGSIVCCRELESKQRSRVD
ncbi:hypothetical protein C8R41DRAFT_308232 [Lentinula lateritia]|uniref:Uncharacterized protein n=1 Tax=Lentinula lateritia TaxID=40482 RepID=A0ABQ8VK94_9AGAR|nr:hypothetical protein C8R41DRAFT_308232 [Lentinula lateritia]